MPAHCWQRIIDGGGKCRAARDCFCLAVLSTNGSSSGHPSRLSQCFEQWVQSNNAISGQLHSGQRLSHHLRHGNASFSMCVSGCSLVCGFSLCNLDVQTQHLCSARIIYHLYRAVTHRVNLGSVVSVPSADIRCPFCSKPFPGGRIEDHLLSCLTSPPLPYNSKYRATKILLQLCLLKGWWLNVRVFSYA